LYAEEVIEGCGDELLNCFGVADGFVHLTQVGFNLMGLDGVLGEDAA